MGKARKVVIVGGLLTVWNAIGLFAFLHDFMMTPADIAKLPTNASGMYMMMPGWEWADYGIGTSAGLLASVALLARRAWAEPLSLISLVAVLIQFGNMFLTRYAVVRTAPGAIGFAALITIIAAMQFGFARQWRKAGLLRA